MSIEEKRKQAYLRFVVEAKDNGGSFENPELNKGWQIWNAALDSVEIQLPQEEPGYLLYAPDVVEAIEAAGLKVKP